MSAKRRRRYGEIRDGADFRRQRELCGISQRAAAESLLVTKRTIIRWESGKHAIPAWAGIQAGRLFRVPLTDADLPLPEAAKELWT